MTRHTGVRCAGGLGIGSGRIAKLFARMLTVTLSTRNVDMVLLDRVNQVIYQLRRTR